MGFSEPSAETAFNAVIRDTVAEVAAIRYPAREVLTQIKVETGLDQCRVLGDRHAGYVEPIPVEVKASAAEVSASPKACCQTNDTCGVMLAPFQT